MSKNNQITVRDFALNYNEELNRRGHRMSEGYLYRLIRQDIGRDKVNGKIRKPSRPLWFKYVLIGDKERILIEI